MKNQSAFDSSPPQIEELPEFQKKTLCDLSASVVENHHSNLRSPCLCGKHHLMDINQLTSKIIGAAIEVHKTIGPGLLEGIYEDCLCIELESRRIPFERQKGIDIEYKGVKLNNQYRLDLVVNNMAVVEIKTVDKLAPIHDAQILTYLKLTGLRVGLLINFNVPILKDGIKRLVL